MDEQPTLGEVGRRILDLRDDIAVLSHRFDGYLLKAVWEAEKRAQDERMTRIEEDRRHDRAEMQRLKESSRATWRWVITSFLSPVVVGVILAWMLGGGP